MSERCPTCGQVVQPRPNYMSADEIMAAMEGRRGRHVYVANDGSWHITHSGDFPGRRVSERVIMGLVEAGKLRLAYKGVPGCYGVEDTVDVDATLELRRRTGDKSKVVYA